MEPEHALGKGVLLLQKSEIARDITLKMIDSRLLQLDDYKYDTDEEISTCNKRNAKEIADFYNYIFDNICN